MLALSLALSLSFCSFLSVSLSSLYPSLSLFVPLYPPLSLSLFLILFFSLPPSLSLFVPLSPSLSLILFFSFCISVLSLPPFLSLSLSIPPSLSLSLSLFVCMCIWMEPLIGFYPIPTSADRYVLFYVVESAQKNPLLYENIPLLFEPHKKTHPKKQQQTNQKPPPKYDINIKQQVPSLCGDLCNMHSKIQFDTVSSNRYFC